MDRCLTQREQQFVDLAAGLADDFKERAAEHDVESSFPFENYDRMREAGYLGLSVPKELGGMGATLMEMCLAQERLAAGCAATALAVTMHISPIGQLSTLWQAGVRPELEDLLRRAATGEVVYASMSADPGYSLLDDSSTKMTRVDGGYLVNGSKVFGTGSSVCTHFSTLARYDDPDAGPTLMFFILPRDVEGMEVELGSWNTMGMRGTQSNSFTLTDVFVPEDAVFNTLPVDHYDASLIKTVWGWSMPVFGSVYLGIAAGAMEEARAAVAKRGGEGRADFQRTFAEMEILLETGRSVIRAHALDYDSGRLYMDLPVQKAIARAVLPKYVATNYAVRIVDLALAVTGGSGFYKKSPIERAYRDVRAGPLHPYNNFDALNLIGKTSLDIEIHPAIEAADAPLLQKLAAIAP
jgi:alkylation response protein AidB-like acyl-CoA dehydrogenase